MTTSERGTRDDDGQADYVGKCCGRPGEVGIERVGKHSKS